MISSPCPFLSEPDGLGAVVVLTSPERQLKSREDCHADMVISPEGMALEEGEGAGSVRSDSRKNFPLQQ